MNGYLACVHNIRQYQYMTWVFVLLISASLYADDHGTGASNPMVACGLMSDHGLPTRGGYKEAMGGVYSCASRSRPLSLGGKLSHEIRYVATGSAQKVSSLNLQLFIKSRENIPSAHKRLLQYAQHMLNEVLETDVPAEMEVSILSGNSGKFQIKDAKVEVMKAHIRTISYELNVRLKI